MSDFLKKLTSFLSYSLLLTLSFCLGYIIIYKITPDDVPAPNLSNSYSFNEKMMFLKNQKQKADIISIGSSMNLNNLHSTSIIENSGYDSYLNAASWGSNIEETYFTLKILNSIYHPNKVIISSNLIDFKNNSIKIKYSYLKDYIKPPTPYSDFKLSKTFNIRYYLENFKYAKKVRSCVNEYEYLKFDRFGGLNYSSKDFNINQDRWNAKVVDSGIDSIQYNYLDSISVLCKSENIQLLFFQSPIRYGVYSKMNSEEKKVLTKHIQKVQSILEKEQHHFVNANDVIWEDHLFVDATHFHQEGAFLYTQYCFHKINYQNFTFPNQTQVVKSNYKDP